MRKVNPSFACLQKVCAKTHSEGNLSLGVAMDGRLISQVSDNNPSQMFVPSSETATWLPCFCPLPNIWNIQQTISFSRKPAGVFLWEAVKRAQYAVFWRSVEFGA